MQEISEFYKFCLSRPEYLAVMTPLALGALGILKAFWSGFSNRSFENKPSCDKGNHKERSRTLSPVHEKHWKKVR